MNQQRFDEFYLTICKEVGGIEGFVKSFFDFLFRKTDFFYECDPGDKMGFPPGYNKQLIFGIMEQFQKEHYKKVPQKSPEEFNRKVEAAKAKQQLQQNSNPKEQIKAVTQQTVQKQQKKQKPQEKPKEQKVIVEQKKQGSSVKPIVNTYNGGSNQKYSWSQQIREVEVTIQVQTNLTAKMIDVKLKNDHISIRKKTGETIVDGNLYEKINASESMWKIQKSANKTFITLNLQKAEEKIWGTVFKGDPEIDTTKVNNTKPLQDFDDQTRGAIEKIMYEQKRKQMGLPTSQEQKQIEALKQAWDAQGSPFKGQPFDPSLVNFSGQNSPFQS